MISQETQVSLPKNRQLAKPPVTPPKDVRNNVTSLCALTMSNFVDRFLLWTSQPSVLIECVFFEEEPDFVTGG